MKRNKIYEKDTLYTILRYLVDWNIRYSYRKRERVGEDNIPEDGALIICPNHCNTLMDALVMLCAHNGSTVFGARADIFRKPIIAKIMYFLRILPMVRQRDGLRNVLKNQQTQETIVETLENGVRFCLFPEGTHRTKHSLQVLGKGAFRIALEANSRFGDKKPVYIIPVGIEYGDYFRYRSTSLVNYGKPINVTEFIKNTDLENDAQIIDLLRKEVSGRMSELMTYIPADENYDSKWTLLKMLEIADSRKGYGDFGTSLYEGMTKNRKYAAAIEKALVDHPEKMQDILEKVADFDKKRNTKQISIYSFRKKCSWNAVCKGLRALIGLPYFIYSAVVSMPMWVAAVKIRSSVKDKAFMNTVSFGIKLGLGTILSIIYAILAFCLAPWWLATILFALYIPSYAYFHDYIEGCRRWISDLRLIRDKKLYKEFRDIVKVYETI